MTERQRQRRLRIEPPAAPEKQDDHRTPGAHLRAIVGSVLLVETEEATEVAGSLFDTAPARGVAVDFACWPFDRPPCGASSPGSPSTSHGPRLDRTDTTGWRSFILETVAARPATPSRQGDARRAGVADAQGEGAGAIRPLAILGTRPRRNPLPPLSESTRPRLRPRTATRRSPLPRAADVVDRGHSRAPARSRASHAQTSSCRSATTWPPAR
jgi:hypothetical protein